MNIDQAAAVVLASILDIEKGLKALTMEPEFKRQQELLLMDIEDMKSALNDLDFELFHAQFKDLRLNFKSLMEDHDQLLKINLEKLAALTSTIRA